MATEPNLEIYIDRRSTISIPSGSASTVFMPVFWHLRRVDGGLTVPNSFILTERQRSQLHPTKRIIAKDDRVARIEHRQLPVMTYKTTGNAWY